MNVAEKLEKKGLSFLTAFLGSYANKEHFLESQSGQYPNMAAWDLTPGAKSLLRQHITELSHELGDMFDTKNRIAAIEQERAVELVGEGQRSFDLRRWRTIEKAFGVTGPGYAGYYCTDTYGGRKQQWYVNPTARDIQRAYIFAIPQSERDRNPYMSQNTPWL